MIGSPGYADGTAMLHLILTAEQASWQQCRRLCSPGDQVVLAAAAVGALSRPDSLRASDFPCEVRAMDVDVAALGYEEATRAGGVELISDADFVRLTEAHSKILSWT